MLSCSSGSNPSPVVRLAWASKSMSRTLFLWNLAERSPEMQRGGGFCGSPFKAADRNYYHACSCFARWRRQRLVSALSFSTVSKKIGNSISPCTTLSRVRKVDGFVLHFFVADSEHVIVFASAAHCALFCSPIRCVSSTSHKNSGFLNLRRKFSAHTRCAGRRR